MRRRILWAMNAYAPAILLTAAAVFGAPQNPGAERLVYRSPCDLAFSPDGDRLAVSDRTAGEVVFIDVRDNRAGTRVPANGRPAGVVWPTVRDVYVAEYDAGTVVRLDASSGRVVERYRVGPKPLGIAAATRKKLLVVTEVGLDAVHIIDLTAGQASRQVRPIRSPCCVTTIPDEPLALVGSLLPRGPANDHHSAAEVTLIDLDTAEAVDRIVLPGGSTNVRKLTVTADGKWAYVAHTIGNVAMPTTQLHHGWVNTNAVSVIDVGKRKWYVTFLLDRLERGGADPWGLVVSADGRNLWSTLAGVHQLARVEVDQLQKLLTGGAGEDVYRRATEAEIPSRLNLWHEIRRYPASREYLHYDLAALPAAGLLHRYDLPIEGPRGLALSPDGSLLAVAAYFSGAVLILEASTGKIRSRVSLGHSPKPDIVRRGEILFHDATLALEEWLSCATCHPESGRADGLNWDLTNDGFGNAKNTKSLLLSHKTPPAMATAVRAHFGVAVEAGIRHILYQEPQREHVEALRAYIQSLEPERNPHLVSGRLSKLAQTGKAVFESSKTQCSRCHPGPLFTDLKTHHVGPRAELDLLKSFDTPSLVELWRTAPYLHSGAAVTVREVLTRFNPEDRHGRTSHLSKKELDALEAYLLSL
jgi:DNA-binding beta-propeller fold protein YncE